ncbi:hypothetical protein H8B02_18125 [Bradyrhizobium sp. Pear77]|uniref:hypothetical protein n=1 Tax=Bradyrhizobium altum TaxID=1571202 RepID=UPI001E2F3EA8|nr:hypothetical protein [Bradyrhizobium altum]MCC8955285.1 hypothetical protein [Bradyrhizobium altum]
MTDSNLVAQLNGDWRVTLLHDSGAWKCAAWSIEQRNGGAWRGLHAIRSRAMLFDLVRSRCGNVDPAAASILTGLPHYSYRRGEPRPPLGKRKKPIAPPMVERKPATSVISEAAQQFLNWRQSQPRR